jgi:hypothetical protein
VYIYIFGVKIDEANEVDEAAKETKKKKKPLDL